jgi:threonine synthase
VTTLLDRLECARCGEAHDASSLQSVCRACGGPLLARYRVPVRDTLPARVVGARPEGLRQLAELSPAREASTPILRPSPVTAQPGYGLAVDLDLPAFALLDARRGPTGSLFDRSAAEALGKATELRIGRVAVASLGPYGLATAAAAALHGIEAHVFLPEGSTFAEPCRARGATVTTAGKSLSAVRERLGKDLPGGFLDVTPGREPYGLEGAKTVAFELLTRLRRLPEVLVVHTDEAASLVALWKGWNEAEDLGWIGSARPRVFHVEPEGCAPIAHAFRKGWQEAKPARLLWRRPTIAVDDPPYSGLLLAILARSEGGALSVPPEEIDDARAATARHLGLELGDAACLTVAGAKRLRTSTIDRSQFVAGLLTC